MFSAPHPARFPSDSEKVKTKRGKNDTASIDTKTPSTPSAAKVEEKLIYTPLVMETGVCNSDSAVITSKDTSSILADFSEPSHLCSSVGVTVEPESSNKDPPVVVEGEVIALGAEFQEEVEKVLSAGLAGSEFISVGEPQKKVTPSLPKSDNESDADAANDRVTSSSFGSWVGSKLGSLWGSTSAGLAKSSNFDTKRNNMISEGVIGPEASGATVFNSSMETPNQPSSIFEASGATHTVVPLNHIPKDIEGRRPDTLTLHSSDPFQAHSEQVSSLSLAADKRSVVSCSKDATMKVCLCLLNQTVEDHLGYTGIKIILSGKYGIYINPNFRASFLHSF